MSAAKMQNQLLGVSFSSTRAWRAFCANRRALVSLYVFSALCLLCLLAPFIANDRPLIIYFNGEVFFPIFFDYPETTFGGEFATSADYHDPFVKNLILGVNPNNKIIHAPLPYSYDTIMLERAAPSAPSLQNPLGTDDISRDVLARLLYGLRSSIAFGMVLTAFSAGLGLLFGAICGYFGGRIDLLGQRVLEVWSGLPSLFVLIILSSLFAPSFWTILGAMLLFSWSALVPFVRAEFLRVRTLDYIRAARALGLTNTRIIARHILPNALIATLTYLPFLLIGSIATLASLDFLGLGLPPPSPSLGELLAQGKNNLNAPWLALSGFFSVSLLLCLLVFIGEGLRDALAGRMARC